MTAPTLTSELLKLADKIAAFSPSKTGPIALIARERRMIEDALRQAASQGSAGGERSAVQSADAREKIRAHLVQMCLASGDGTYIHHNATEVIDAILSLGVAQAAPYRQEQSRLIYRASGMLSAASALDTKSNRYDKKVFREILLAAADDIRNLAFTERNKASSVPSAQLGCGDPNCKDPSCGYGK